MAKEQGAYLPIVQEVYYGEACMEDFLRSLLQDRRCKRVLVVTGPSAWSDLSLRGYVLNALGGAFAGCFTEASEGIRLDVVFEIMAAAEDVGADGLLSLGSGSAIDMTKAAIAGLAYGLRDQASWADAYVHWEEPEACNQRTGPMLLQLAAPTTLAGAQHSSGIGLTGKNWTGKRMYKGNGRGAQPAIVFLDSRVTEATPRGLWLSTAFKALEHAIERSYSFPAHPIIDTLALEAASRIMAALEQIARGRDDSSLRMELLIGSWLSMLGGTLELKMGLSHALGRQITSIGKLPHGLIACVTLAPVMRFNLPYVHHDLALVEHRLGEQAGDPVLPSSTHALAERFISRVETLVQRLRLPFCLRQLELEPLLLPTIAEHVIGDHGLSGNPIQPDYQDVLRLLKHMYIVEADV